MTVIAAKKIGEAIEFAADRQTTAGHRKCTDNEMQLGKLQSVNGMTIGSSGLRSVSLWLFHFARNHAPLEPTEVDVAHFFLEFTESMKRMQGDFRNENCFLMAFRGRLFHVFDSLSVFEVPSFSAIGSGRDFAVAAMHLGHTAEQAARISAELDIYCSGEIDVIRHQ